jgi:hypothetical protein
VVQSLHWLVDVMGNGRLFGRTVPPLALVAGLVGIAPAGCSSASEPPPDPVAAKFAGQLVALMPFDPTNPACDADPDQMTLATIAACTSVDGSKLSPDTLVTEDPEAFDPKAPSSILIVRGPSLDPTRTDGWIGIVGMGAAPATDGSLAKTTELRPRFVPLIIAGVALTVDEVALLFFGAGTAIVVSRGTTLSRPSAQPIVTGTQAVVTKQTQLLRTCEDGSQVTCNENTLVDLNERKANACNVERACTGAMACSDLQTRISRNSDCLTARDRVTDVCCGGNSGPNHDEQRQSVVNALDNCKSLFQKFGC